MAWAADTLALGAANSKSSSTTLTTGALSAAVATGKLVLVAVGGLTHSTSISSVTDTKGNTYTALADANLGISRVAIYGTVVTSALTTSDTITANWAAAVSTRVMAASSFTGGTLTLTGSTPTTVAGTASASMSVGPSAGSMASGDLAFAAFVSTNATDTWTFGAGTGFTTAHTATTGNTGTNRSIGSEYQIMGSAGAVTATATQTGIHAYDAVLIGLQAAGGGTSTDSGTSLVGVVGQGGETQAEAAGAPLVIAGAGAEATADQATSTLAVVGSGAESVGLAEAGASALAVVGSGTESVVTPTAPVIGEQGGRIIPMLPPTSKRLQALIQEMKRKRQHLAALTQQAAEARHEQGAKRRGAEIARLVERIGVLDAQIAEGQARREARAVAAQLAEQTRQRALERAGRRERLRTPIAEPTQPLEHADLVVPRTATAPPLYVPADWQDEEDLMTLLAHR